MIGTGEAPAPSGDSEHPFVQLARRAVEEYVERQRVLDAPVALAAGLTERAGVFVSIKKRGELRGCIGTFEPMQANLGLEVIHNAIASASRDPRFPPVRRDELPFLSVSVDVLGMPEPVEDETALDPKRYGVIVSRGARRGLLLPDLEGIDTVAQQLAVVRAKAGLLPGEPVELLRFEVRRYL